MEVVSNFTIDGPEAKGTAEINKNDDGNYILEFERGFWVAPGAPDVTITISPNKQGVVNDEMIELGLYEYGKASQSWLIPTKVNLQEMNTVIVYCKQYTAHFGHGTIM